MAYADIKNKLDRGDLVLLDGGTGTEIEKQGVAMNEQAWCGIAHMEQPDVVVAVHESYINAGSDVVIANTFATAPHIVRQLGLEEQTEKINAEAVKLAPEIDRLGGLYLESIQETHRWD